MASGREILLSDLPPELMDEKEARPPVSDHWEQSLQSWARTELEAGHEKILDSALPTFERVMIEVALEKTGGRKKEAAELLGWGRNTLTRKLKELNMTQSDDED